ncbi:MAG: DUF6049 family protein [Acidimicrobiales bacterium]
MTIDATVRYTGNGKSHHDRWIRAIPRFQRPRLARRTLSFSLGSLVIGLTFTALLLVSASPGRNVATRLAHIGNSAASTAITTATTSTTVHPRLSLVYQSPWANLSHPYNLRFNLTGSTSNGTATTNSASVHASPLKLSQNLLTHYSVTALVYNRLTSQSAFQASLGNVSGGSILAQSNPMPLSGLAQNMQGDFNLTVAINDGYTSSSTSSALIAGLSCTPGNGTCHGVYPLQLVLQASQSGGSGSSSTVSTLDTYMIYVRTTSPTERLRVSWIVPLMLPVQVAGANGMSISASRNSLNAFSSELAAIKNNPATPMTLFPEPAALRQIMTMASDGNTTARIALNDLATISAIPNHEILSGPYAPINVSQLANANLVQQISNQLKQGKNIMNAAHLHSYGHFWLASLPLSDQGASALQTLGITNLAVHTSNLNLQYTHLTPTNPFTLNLSKSHSVTGYPLDSSSNSILSEANTIGPTLAAYDLIANIAIVYFEAPFQSTPRGITVYHSQNYPMPATLTNTLLTLLSSNPIIQPVTVSQYMRQVPLLPRSSSRSLLLSSKQARLTNMPSQLYTNITKANRTLKAFKSSFTSNSVYQSLYDLFLASCSSTLSTDSSLLALSGLNGAISRYLHNISIVSDKTVTFTSSRATIPITLTSKLKYPVKVLLELQSNGISSAAGRYKEVVLMHSTTVVYVPVIIRATGYFRVTVKLVSVQGAITIATARLPVRSAAISFVAVILSLGAILILLWWWLHTLMLKRSDGDRHSPRHLHRS